MLLNLQKLQGANLFAGNDATRYYLHGVLLQCKKGVISLVATDGYRLIKIKETREENKKEKNCCFIIPSSLIKKIKLESIARGVYREDMEVSIKKSLITIDYGTDSFRENEIDGTFPDYRKVMPDEKKYTKSKGLPAVCANPAYLSDFAKVNARLGHKNAGVKLEFLDWESPILIRMNGELKTEYTGVLMPMRLD